MRQALRNLAVGLAIIIVVAAVVIWFEAIGSGRDVMAVERDEFVATGRRLALWVALIPVVLFFQWLIRRSIKKTPNDTPKN